MIIKLRFLCILFLLLSVTGISQIYSPDNHYSELVQYVPFKDSVFVFNQPAYGDRISITLASVSPDSTDGWTFTWFKYDTVSLDYSFFFSNTSLSSEIDTISSYSGYRLIRSKGGYIDTSQVWVLFHDFKAAITDKDVNGNIPVGQTTCFSTSLTTQLPVSNYSYHIPGNNSMIKDTIKYQITWKNNPQEGGLPPTRFGYVTMSNPPYENTTYTQIVRSIIFGLERRDSVNYIAVKSKSDIGNDYIELSDINHYPAEYGEYYRDTYTNVLGEEYSAPAKFKFYNKESKNAARFYLTFGDDSDTTFYNTGDTIVHEYFFPGEYTATLYTYSPKPTECVDSSTAEIVLANPSFGEGDSIKFPNVFTPNGAENNVFRTRDISIYSFTIIIYNRYGKKVHEFSGNIRDWKGWDGHIMNSERMATEGIYYYVVDYIVAFESKNNIMRLKEYDKKQKTGFVYLLLGEGNTIP